MTGGSDHFLAGSILATQFRSNNTTFKMVKYCRSWVKLKGDVLIEI